ncbi:hypothetical protein CUJ83_10530 [Methanocella sp. CWC-04]|uniref:Uncharacterized protein n=2 Tax=Methanooceanicella nereidis TaxID=2052831 RepID=A0AAP2RDS5_9EURY|nr:hypothetical protein [Methanocella sp. CWC-04]
MIESLPSWSVYLFIILILIIDVISFLGIVLTGVILVGLFTGKIAYGVLEKTIYSALNFALCTLEDALEDSRYGGLSIFIVPVVVAIKIAYGIVSAIKNLFEGLLGLGAGIAGIAFIVINILVLVVINGALVWLILNYAI